MFRRLDSPNSEQQEILFFPYSNIYMDPFHFQLQHHIPVKVVPSGTTNFKVLFGML